MSLPDYWHEYWDNYVEAFVHPLTANGILGKFISNANVTGAYGEAWIRSMVSSMLPQFRVSTGAVIRPSDQKLDRKLTPQCDLIIWDPSELPALFEKGDFALVPNLSVKAIIEVKRSCTEIKNLNKQLKKQQNLLIDQYRANVLGIVISHPTKLFPEKEIVTPTWLEDAKYLWLAEPAKVRVFNSPPNKSSIGAPDKDEIFAFIYFLSQIAKQN